MKQFNQGCIAHYWWHQDLNPGFQCPGFYSEFWSRILQFLSMLVVTYQGNLPLNFLIHFHQWNKERTSYFIIFFFLFIANFIFPLQCRKIYLKTFFSPLFWMNLLPDCSWLYIPGFPPSPWVLFTKSVLGHPTLTPTLVSDGSSMEWIVLH